ncbi:MAG: glycerophosphodiester phosphodiesterase [Candidatus Omnitrophica bacterium]|nr:glycerophosphodiester phosphodiesterase [Candidatus Omnitrophota bacterium]
MVARSTRLDRRPLIIAHRGASGSAPESTRAAIARALALRADMIELDVQLTRDNRLVAFHDDRLERTTNGSGWLRHWAYRELARLDSGGWFHPDFSGQHILPVSTALRMIPVSCLVNLELKRTRKSSQLVERLGSCLRWTGAARRVLVSSFDPALVERWATAYPRVARGLLCRVRPRASLRLAVRLGCRSFHPHHSLVRPALVADAHTAGLRVYTWTVDAPHEAQRLFRLGVDGIFTNQPERMRPTRRAFLGQEAHR